MGFPGWVSFVGLRSIVCCWLVVLGFKFRILVVGVWLVFAASLGWYWLSVGWFGFDC